MLLLTSVSDLITVITDAASAIRVHADWVDNNAGTITPERTNTGPMTTATTTTVVAAPASGVQRNVKNLTIHNEHTTVNCGVAVQHTDGTNAHDQVMVILLPKETLVFNEVGQWVHYDADAVPKTSQPTVIVKALPSDQSNSTTTLTEVTGLTMSVGVGVYQFRYCVIYQAAALTTGVRFSVNHTGTVSKFVAWRRGLDVSATAATAAPDQDNLLATGAVFFGFGARAKSTTGWGTTLSVDVINADMMEVIEGLMVVTASGNIALWHGSEVAAASTVMAGSSLVVTKVG